MLQLDKLTVRYGPLTILEQVSFGVEENQWLMVIGPNGAGKSTLVAAISQGVPYTGDISFGGQNIRALNHRQRAKSIGVVMQSHHVGYSFTVEEVAGLGRYAYSGGILSTASAEDRAKTEAALAATGMLEARKQSVLTLSGGELQRTFLAQALAQDPRLLLLDEPTSHLDLVYQKQVFSLVDKWYREPGRGVVSVVHDLSLARAYGTHVLLLSGGKAAAFGTVEQVFSGDVLNRVYGMDVGGWMREMLSQW